MSDHAIPQPSRVSLREASAPQQQTSERKRILRRFMRYKPGLAGLGIIILLVTLALFAPWIAPYSPEEINTPLRGANPSSDYWLGNDDIGRDILSRLIYGSRIALIVGVGATAIAVTIGVTVGALAGYFGGKVDFILSRLVDTLMAFPLLALLLTLSSVFGPSLRNVVVVIGLTVWASYARLVRAEVLSLRERDFVLAARASGAGDRRIIFRHIVPNALGPVIVIASLAVGGVIILESALSFLGLGVSRPTASWGTMLSDGREYIRNYPHIAIAPGVAITITVLSFNLVGDGLRDALDPRQRD
ncbi:MAG: ABC transporter permease [Chloroflexia bacterium]|jgi:peptide/nickel transport system permease protein|nr:ABC transporter permease [Chloroflexia bacterium]MDQ3613730.1 ABC transporter permease [Chloroflexota bacterium]